MYVVCYKIVARYRTVATYLSFASKEEAWKHVDNCPNGHKM